MCLFEPPRRSDLWVRHSNPERRSTVRPRSETTNKPVHRIFHIITSEEWNIFYAFSLTSTTERSTCFPSCLLWWPRVRWSSSFRRGDAPFETTSPRSLLRRLGPWGTGGSRGPADTAVPRSHDSAKRTYRSIGERFHVFLNAPSRWLDSEETCNQTNGFQGAWNNSWTRGL